MLLQGASLVLLITLQTISCATMQDDKIEPVNLSYTCMQSVVHGEESNKSPILLLHGLTSSAATWQGVMEVLALRTGRKVCAADLRNHGDSPWSEHFDVEVMTADIAQLLDKEKIQKINFIGHSLGGKISLHYALKNPDRVNSLVVEDLRANGATEISIQMTKRKFEILDEVIKKIPKDSTEDQARKFIVDALQEKLKELGINEEVDENTAKELPLRCVDGKCGFIYNFDVIKKAVKMMDPLLMESTGLYEGPTLFIYGENSILDVAGDKENILKLFPNAQFVGVKGAGHKIHGFFKQFDDEVLRFLERLS